MKEEQYGILLNEEDVIVYFEFDTSEAWDKTTGGKNGKTAAVIQEFTPRGIFNGIASYYFNPEDRSLLVLTNDQNGI